MFRKHIQQKVCGKGDHSYVSWSYGRIQHDEGGAHEVPEANPDVLPAPVSTVSVETEALRLLLDNPSARLSLFSPLQDAVFMTVHVDGRSERFAAKRLRRSLKEIRLAVRGVRVVVKRTIERMRSGLDALTGK